MMTSVKWLENTFDKRRPVGKYSNFVLLYTCLLMLNIFELYEFLLNNYLTIKK